MTLFHVSIPLCWSLFKMISCKRSLWSENDRRFILLQCHLVAWIETASMTQLPCWNISTLSTKQSLRAQTFVAISHQLTYETGPNILFVPHGTVLSWKTHTRNTAGDPDSIWLSGLSFSLPPSSLSPVQPRWGVGGSGTGEGTKQEIINPLIPTQGRTHPPYNSFLLPSTMVATCLYTIYNFFKQKFYQHSMFHYKYSCLGLYGCTVVSILPFGVLLARTGLYKTFNCFCFSMLDDK